MSLLKSWSFKPVQPWFGESLWYPCRNDTYGNQVHLDLYHNDLIPHPFVNDNHVELQWIQEMDWEYRCLFNCTTSDSLLIFEGLDTFASVSLNDEIILHNTNAFHRHKIHLKTLEENELRIIFNSSYLEGKKLQSIHGEKQVWNGDSSRVYVRKPQHQYGWDWQPTFHTVGPWRPVRLITEPYVDDIFIKYQLSDDLTIAYLSIEISAFKLDTFEFAINGEIISCNEERFNYTLESVNLWYPKQLGTPYLYNFEVISNNQSIKLVKFGFRKIELLQPFYFKVNNIPLQVYGVNWIPLNAFISNSTVDEYHKMIHLINDANFNLIRVWGGGIYEIDEFYTKCDELGILIWQDFMFSCGIYPDSDIEKEIEDQIIRLRKFTSIVVYSGNNEDYQLADSLGLDINNQSQFPAKNIYETLIPTKLGQLSNRVVYRYGSPYSNNSTSANDESIGDCHQWKVWLNDMEPYQNWMKLSAKFVSEFGMFSLPSMYTLTKYIHESQLFPYSSMIDSHSNADKYYLRLNHYLQTNFNYISEDLSEFIYLSQLLQSDALSLAYRYWRYKWKDYEVGGIILWQMNDCWPGLSWSIIDYEKLPKLAYYGIRRELQSNVIGLYRTRDSQKPTQTILKSDSVSIWILGSEIDACLKVEFYHGNGSLYHTETFNPTNNTTVVENYPVLDHTIVHAKLIKNSKVIARASDWPTLKRTNITNKNLNISYLNNGTFLFTTDKPVKGLQLEFDQPYVYSDNGIDLFPNDPQIIHVYDFNESAGVHRVKYYSSVVT